MLPTPFNTGPAEAPAARDVDDAAPGFGDSRGPFGGNLGMDYCRHELSNASRLLLAQHDDNALLQDELDRRLRSESLSDRL
jgi:hypothetical protein